MTRKLVVTVESTDESDLDWLNPRIDGAVQDVIDEANEDGRMDGEVTYYVEYDD